MKTLLMTVALISTVTSAFAQTVCDQQLDNILADYAANGKPVQSYKILDCPQVTKDMPAIFDENVNTDAPEVRTTSACAIVLDFGSERLRELAIFDSYNDFVLVRDFDRESSEYISQSQLGGRKGYLSYSKSQGDYKDEDGFLNSIDSIISADFNFKNNTLRLMSWDVGFFWNTYHHEYTVQCRQVQ